MIAPSRRKFLKLGLGGSLLLAAGGGIFSWRWLTRGYAQLLAPGDKPLGLSVKEFVIARAFVNALLPAEDGFPSGDSLGLPQRLDEEIWVAPAELGADLKAGLQLLEHATLWNGFSARFTALPAPAQRAYIGKLLSGSNNTLCIVALAFKEMVYLFYYGHPDVWKYIGYEGPLIAKAVPPESAIAYRALLRKTGGA
jgi:hypothetical protein